MKFEILVNSKLNVKTLNGKPTDRELSTFNTIENWIKLSVTPQTLYKLITVGNSVCGTLKNTVKESSNDLVTAIFLDIDKCDSISSVTEHEFVRQHAAIVHQTISSTPNNPRLRVCFILATPVSLDHARAILIKLQRSFNQADKSCIDPGRLYYGLDRPLEPELLTDNLFPDNYVREDEISLILSEFNEKPINVTLNENRTTEKLISIWGQISEDFQKYYDNPLAFIENFFPLISDCSEIKPQADNVVRQFRGNPTYRDSTTGKSFDIFFNKDKTVTWCDKSDFHNLKGHAVDFYYRYLMGDIYKGIPLNDSEKFWDTLKKMYSEVQIFFDQKRFKQISSQARKSQIRNSDIYDFIDFEGKKPIIDERELLLYFLEANPALYCDATRKYYIFNGLYYVPYSSAKMLTFLNNWIESLFDDRENEFFKYLFSLRRIKSIFNSLLNLIPVHDQPITNNTDFINFENGLFDIKNQTLIEHSSDIIHIYCNPYRFEPTGSKLAVFRNLISKLIPENHIENFIRFAACAVSNKGSEIGLMLAAYGESGSGKTSITNALLDLVSFDKALNPQSLSTDFFRIFGDKSNSYGTSQLLNKTLVCFSEMSDFNRLSTSELAQFKSLIGNDKTSFDYNIKYGGNGSTEGSIAFMLTCEDLPAISIEDEGLFRRIYWVPFTKSKEDLSAEFGLLFDPNFLEGLLSDLLVLPVDEYVNYFKSNLFSTNLKSRDIASGDPYVLFMENYISINESSNVTLKEMQAAFQVHLMDIGEKDQCGSRRQLKKFLKALHICYDYKATNYNPKNRDFPGIKLK